MFQKSVLKSSGCPTALLCWERGNGIGKSNGPCTFLFVQVSQEEGAVLEPPTRLRTDLLNNFTRNILISHFEEIGSEIFGGPTPPSRIGEAFGNGKGLQPFFVRQVSQE